MELTAVRDIDPDKLEISFSMTAEDLAAAFAEDTPESRDLFFALFGKKFLGRANSDQLGIVSRAAARAESALSLNITLGEPEQK